MSRRILVVPTNHGSGLTSVCLGLVRALDERGVNVGFLKPLAQPHRGKPDRTAHLVGLVSTLTPPEPITAAETESYLFRGQTDPLMELVLGRSEQTLAERDVVVIEGLVPNDDLLYAGPTNRALAKALDAEVILVSAVYDDTPEHIVSLTTSAADKYQVGEGTRVIGAILSRANGDIAPYKDALAEAGIRMVGAVPNREDITYPRVCDLVAGIGLDVLSPGDQTRRIRRTTVMARSLPGFIQSIDEGTLIVTPGDRSDVILATALAATNGTHPAALLLTAGIDPDEGVLALCQAALASGLPLLRTDWHTFEAALAVSHLDREIPEDDAQRASLVAEVYSEALDDEWLENIRGTTYRHRLSPAAFRRELTLRARAANKRIVLPEGSEPRTIEAAIHCQEKGIASCVLLGDPAEIATVAGQLGLTLPQGLTIIDPARIPDRYVDALVERRGHKGMTRDIAKDTLEDTVVLGTMMLYLGEVDGLVSGAVHTTANTIRPALQILGTKPGARLVSSVFFMGLPDEVVIYGDCAVNPDPNAEQLADIAIQSADSARAFGIEPRVAMISYSTGTSGTGADVDKVKAATDLVRELRPDIVVDGPLQYDAATTMSVAKSKAPGSPVAGKATVLVFPDLNTGNTTYKAVQRSASVISVGPMLQGIAAPVNDLSRGALVEDIEYTIALTAIQAVAN